MSDNGFTGFFRQVAGPVLARLGTPNSRSAARAARAKNGLAEIIVASFRQLDPGAYGAVLTGHPERKGEAPARYFVSSGNRPVASVNVIVGLTDTRGDMYFVGIRRHRRTGDPDLDSEERLFLPTGPMRPALPAARFGFARPGSAEEAAAEARLIGLPPADARAEFFAEAGKNGFKRPDIDMECCAIRTAHEQTGLPLERLLKARRALVGESSRHGYAGARAAHTAACNYLIDLGTGNLPELPADHIDGRVWWVRPADIQFAAGSPRPAGAEDSRYLHKTGDFNVGLPLRDNHGEAAGQAIRNMRSRRLLELSGADLDSLEALVADVRARNPETSLPAPPQSQMGREAARYYREMLWIAERMREPMRAGLEMADTILPPYRAMLQANLRRRTPAPP